MSGKRRTGSRFEHFLLESYFSLQFLEWAIGFVVAGCLCIALGILLFFLLPQSATVSFDGGIAVDGPYQSRFLGAAREVQTYTFANYSPTADFYVSSSSSSCNAVQDVFRSNINRTDVNFDASAGTVSYKVTRQRTTVDGGNADRPVINQPSVEFAQAMAGPTVDGKELNVYTEALRYDDLIAGMKGVFVDGEFRALLANLKTTQSIRSIAASTRAYAQQSFAKYVQGSVQGYAKNVVAAAVTAIRPSFGDLFQDLVNKYCGTPTRVRNADDLSAFFYNGASAASCGAGAVVNAAFKPAVDSIGTSAGGTFYTTSEVPITVLRKFFRPADVPGTPTNVTAWAWVVAEDAICKPGPGASYYGYTSGESAPVSRICATVLDAFFAYFFDSKPYPDNAAPNMGPAALKYATNRADMGLRKFCYEATGADNAAAMPDLVSLLAIPNNDPLKNRATDTAYGFASRFNRALSLSSVYAGMYGNNTDVPELGFRHVIATADGGAGWTAASDADLTRCKNVYNLIQNPTFVAEVLSAGDNVLAARTQGVPIANPGSVRLYASFPIFGALKAPTPLPALSTALKSSLPATITDADIDVARKYLYRMDAAIQSLVADVLRRTVFANPPLLTLPANITSDTWALTNTPAFDLDLQSVRALVFPTSAETTVNSLSYLPGIDVSVPTSFADSRKSGARAPRIQGLVSMFVTPQDYLASTLQSILFNGANLDSRIADALVAAGSRIVAAVAPANAGVQQFIDGSLITGCDALALSSGSGYGDKVPVYVTRPDTTFCGVAQVFYRNYFGAVTPGATNNTFVVPRYPVEFGLLVKAVAETSFDGGLASGDAIFANEVTANTLNPAFAAQGLNQPTPVPKFTARYYRSLAYTVLKEQRLAVANGVDPALRFFDPARTTLQVLDGRTGTPRLASKVAGANGVAAGPELPLATSTSITAQSGKTDSKTTLLDATASTAGKNATESLNADAYLFNPNRPVSGSKLAYRSFDWSGVLPKDPVVSADCAAAAVPAGAVIADLAVSRCNNLVYDTPSSLGYYTVANDPTGSIRVMTCDAAKKLTNMVCKDTILGASNATDTASSDSAYLDVDPISGTVVRGVGCWVVAVNVKGQGPATGAPQFERLYALYRRESSYILSDSFRSGLTSGVSNLRSGATAALVVLVIIGGFFLIAGVVFFVFWGMARKRREEETGSQDLVLDPFNEKTARTVRV